MDKSLVLSRNMLLDRVFCACCTLTILQVEGLDAWAEHLMFLKMVDFHLIDHLFHRVGFRDPLDPDHVLDLLDWMT